MESLNNFEIESRRWLEEHGIESYGMSQREAIECYLTIQNRLIEPKPRSVFISGILKNKMHEVETHSGLCLLETKFRNGDNVNGHLTRKVLDPKYTDPLFSDWGIQHFHLGDEPHPGNKRLVLGTRELLFAVVSEDSAYFIDVLPHKFQEIRLLQIIVDEWPHLMEANLIPWAIEPQFAVTDEKDIKKMRSAGISIIHKINGNCYLPVGGGLTTSGTSVKVRLQMNSLYYAAKFS